jgi:hypothetical protein
MCVAVVEFWFDISKLPDSEFVVVFGEVRERVVDEKRSEFFEPIIIAKPGYAKPMPLMLRPFDRMVISLLSIFYSDTQAGLTKQPVGLGGPS